jgi:hypothetical protein
VKKDSVLAHCLVRALAHNEGGTDALLERFGKDVEGVSKWAAVKAAAKATPLASRVAGFIVQWAVAMQMDEKDEYSITEYQRFWSENERKAYRLQAEFRHLWPEFETPNELAGQIAKYLDAKRMDKKDVATLPLRLQVAV